jgi:serine/threonine-protein kinase HipA
VRRRQIRVEWRSRHGRDSDLLKGSDDPEADRLIPQSADHLLLLGATDGRGFNVFLQPGGRFRLTPLYDVMSVQPAFDAGQPTQEPDEARPAVGDNRHYVLHEIMPRHFADRRKSGTRISG